MRLWLLRNPPALFFYPPHPAQTPRAPHTHPLYSLPSTRPQRTTPKTFCVLRALPFF